MPLKASLASAQGFLAGEEGATKEVYLTYRKLLYFIIRSLVENPDDADDLYQETFVQAISARKEIKDPKKLHYYLCATAKNLALNFIKKRDALVDYSDLLDFYGQDEHANGYLQDLNALLSDAENVVVTYRIAYGLSVDEVAKLTGFSKSKVNLLYSRSLKKLRKELGGK